MRACCSGASRRSRTFPSASAGLKFMAAMRWLPLVTLPPMRQIGMGAAMVAVLEIEARALKCRAIYLLTASDANFFGRLGYAPCARNEVPEAIRASRQFAEFCAPTAAAMVKRIG